MVPEPTQDQDQLEATGDNEEDLYTDKLSLDKAKARRKSCNILNMHCSIVDPLISNMSQHLYFNRFVIMKIMFYI